MELLHKIEDARAWVTEAKKKQKVIGLVPTMGAFHEGHLALMRKARSECDSVVVSLFVNPIQFGQGEDLARYPRDFEGDCRKARDVGVEALFAPAAEEMYPTGFQTRVVPGDLASGLCGPFRPGHFEGVATVVCKLFGICLPDRAYFGEKDYQQLRIVEQMVEDLNLPVKIVRCPTVREPDGLAMSSRNAYLSREEREHAAIIFSAIREAQELVKSGERDARVIERLVEERIMSRSLFRSVDYAHVVDPHSLSRVERIEGEVRLAVAARIGSARLIDNGVLTP